MKETVFPPQNVLAFLDPILHVRPSVVGLDNLLERQPGVRKDEPHSREKFIRAPLDLADHPARLAPTRALDAKKKFKMLLTMIRSWRNGPETGLKSRRKILAPLSSGFKINPA